MLSTPAYEGKTDPTQHIMRYKWLMDSTRAIDATKCRCFPIALSGMATMWFMRLSLRSISRFDDLATNLLEKFRMHVTRPKDVLSLSSMIQALGELLKDYLEIFHMAITEVCNPNDHSILMAVTMVIDLESDFGD